MSPLQSCRVNETSPFTVTGVDFTGALYVKSGNSENKVYICLFTCAVTRAVHLELVPDLTAYSFILSFRKFCARRSYPQHMISDNASTFMSSWKVINALFNSPYVKEFLSNRSISWNFIPKRAPWYGGFWERLIGLTKTTLKKVLGRARITYDELCAVVTEVESVLNDRPLTLISSDVNDETPLTPSHLL